MKIMGRIIAIKKEKWRCIFIFWIAKIVKAPKKVTKMPVFSGTKFIPFLTGSYQTATIIKSPTSMSSTNFSSFSLEKISSYPDGPELPVIGFDSIMNLTQPRPEFSETFFKESPVKSVYYKDRIYFISIRSVPKPYREGLGEQRQNNILPHSLIQVVQPCFIKTVARSLRLFLGSLVGLASAITYAVY